MTFTPKFEPDKGYLSKGENVHGLERASHWSQPTFADAAPTILQLLRTCTNTTTRKFSFFQFDFNLICGFASKGAPPFADIVPIFCSDRTSNRRSTTSRAVSAAGRLRPNEEAVHVSTGRNLSGRTCRASTRTIRVLHKNSASPTGATGRSLRKQKLFFATCQGK